MVSVDFFVPFAFVVQLVFASFVRVSSSSLKKRHDHMFSVSFLKHRLVGPTHLFLGDICSKTTLLREHWPN